MSTDEYVPSDDQVRGRYSDGAHFQGVPQEHDDQSLAAFDAWLARVRRDAAREALDGYAAAEEESFLNLHVKDAPIAAAQCTHAAITAREYRDTHYPEETP